MILNSIGSIAASRAKAPAIVTDPYWSNVVLLVPFESDFADVKAHSHTVVGSPLLNSTDNPAPYGTNSAKFDATSFVQYGDSDDFNFNGTSFTFETWFRPTADDVTYYTYHALLNQRSGDSTGQQIGITNTKLMIWVNGNTLYSGTTTILADTDYYLKVTREFNGTDYTWRVVLNGTPQATFNSSVEMTNIGAPLTLGGDAAGYNQWFKGRMKDTRLTKGIARSSDAVPTAPHPVS